jgi:hypothetical protein
VRHVDAAIDFLSAPVGIPESFKQLDRSEAQSCLAELSRYPAFRESALERGTAAATARIWLNARASGVDLPIDKAAALSAAVVNTD